jgi:hypothetical protein
VDKVVQWLLDGDPAIRWQALRDLVRIAERAVARERGKIARAGRGARPLDHFQAVAAPRDPRLGDAIDIVRRNQRKDGRWSLQHSYRGKTSFELERLGAPSRWNTLRALRVLQWWDRGRTTPEA